MRPWHRAPGLILSALLLAACQQTGDQSEKKSADTDAKEEDVSTIPVEVATPTRGDVYSMYTGTAPVEAFRDATVVAKVGGEVREILVEEGDSVKAGQVMARLDGDRLRLEQQQAEAKLRKLQRDYQRNVDLKDRGLISEGDFEKIKFEMDALDAANDLAKLQLSYAEIRSPIDGVVSQRFIKIGNTLEIEAPTFTVTSLEPLISYLHVPEREYRRIEKGQDAKMIIDALQGAVFDGRVARVSPVVDPATGTFKITIEVIDETRRLKPGMFARIAIVQDAHFDVLQVPRSALLGIDEKTSIFIVEDGVAHRRGVSTGYASEGRVEIVDGLDEGEQFVVVGQAGLKDGAKVSIINGGPAQSSARNETE